MVLHVRSSLSNFIFKICALVFTSLERCRDPPRRGNLDGPMDSGGTSEPHRHSWGIWTHPSNDDADGVKKLVKKKTKKTVDKRRDSQNLDGRAGTCDKSGQDTA